MSDDTQLLHKTILVGITHLNSDEQLASQEQFFGIITAFTDSWVEISLDSGQTRRIPNHLILDAPRGSYECVATGEIVKNPDYLASWKVKPNPDPDSPMLCTPNYAPLVDSFVPQEWKVTYAYDPDHLKHIIATKGEQYIGKHVLARLLFYRKEGDKEEYARTEVVHGHILRVSFNEGVVLSLSDGRQRTLPPDLLQFQPASPEGHVLTATGETIRDVDYVTRWIITTGKDDKNQPGKAQQ